MDMKTLLEKMYKFAGEPEQKPGDQVRGTEKAKKGSKDHPFKGRLVGDSKDNMLKGLAQIAEEKSTEWALAEAYKEFLQNLDEDNLGVEEKRPARKGSRPAREYTKDGKPSNRYNTIKDESRGHKIIARKLKDIEAQGKPVSDEEYAKHVERMKQAKKEYLKKNPNSIYKQEVDEAVPVPPTPPTPPTPPGVQQPPVAGQATPAATQADKQAIAAAMQGSMTIKTATGASASAPNILKALDTATQGKPLPATDAKMLEPVLGVIGQVAKDPKLAGQFKTLASQAQQSALQKQNQQQK